MAAKLKPLAFAEEQEDADPSGASTGEDNEVVGGSHWDGRDWPLLGGLWRVWALTDARKRLGGRCVRAWRVAYERSELVSGSSIIGRGRYC